MQLKLDRYSVFDTNINSNQLTMNICFQDRKEVMHITYVLCAIWNGGHSILFLLKCNRTSFPFSMIQN